MTNNIRVFLWLGLALALYLNYTQWQIDFGPKPATPSAATSDGSATVPATPADTVPQAAQSSADRTGADADVPTPSTPAAAAPAATQAVEAQSAGVVRVTTDVLVLDIDLKGGTLVRAELPGYPMVKGQPDPVVLFNRDNAATFYVMQTGLTSANAEDKRPNHLVTFSSAQDKYELASGQDELRVPITWTDDAGVTVTKTFTFTRGGFAVGLEYQVVNASESPWVANSYARIVRTDPEVERSMFRVESFSFRGPAFFGPKSAGDDNHYHKVPLEDAHKWKLPAGVVDGWIAGLQHHFVSAVVPNPAHKYDLSLNVNDRQFILGVLGETQSVAPGTTAVLKETLFVGPKLQRQLQALHPELDRVADYGFLHLLSRPLFVLLDFLHKMVNNWGLAIILATFLLKLLFYPLSEKAGRSMARMRALAPRMKALQETYKDDRAKLGQATMELYRSEKVNPLAGCLPMLIQMPVFLAFYWVLLESVEMRQAPFFGWINDLSSRDPFFILPALNGLAMWAQYKLNPPPPDPMQAKIFQFMPIIFSVMFALFPAGLVLYWVTNTGLSIAQQWNINRRLEAEDKARKK
jgi:YidC/Oxa1 family membrane protein insertase